MLNIKKLNITTKNDFYFYITGIAAIININFLSPMADLAQAGYLRKIKHSKKTHGRQPN